MAWFNRRKIVWTTEELNWIAENAASEKKPIKMFQAKFFRAENLALHESPYMIEITNLPPETDAPMLKRMFTSRTTGSDF